MSDDLTTLQGASDWVERNVLPVLQQEHVQFETFALAICRLGDDLEALPKPRVVDVTLAEVADELPSDPDDEPLLNFSAWVRALLSTYSGVGVVVCCRVEGKWNTLSSKPVSEMIIVTLEHEGGDRSWHAKAAGGEVEPFVEAPGRWEEGLLARMMPKRWLN